ncbi:Wadjet anti-phage system protein JetA family protein [Aureimonas sp. D3]|uniref:Wadjet anti-phage system protein JetA family protein n=1 Tax=Aureimonas sp. D3 TaxID=1638164 RepID=UPI0009E91627|nr:Wadjet anti-phage system protein JetA family protein [Aureimonas sp. D3]
MPLFDVLPPDLFKPLASSSRRLYADLLLHLHHRTFTLSGIVPRRADVIAEIDAFLARRAPEDSKLEDEGPNTKAEERARTAYERLVETGWLVEYRERYLKLVDLDPEASGLLHLLSDIERGETLSYGGAVLGVLSALESAAGDPAERSENLRNALRGANEFMSHMRTVSVSLRQAEERILSQPSLREVFRHFFENFVERHLIRDFKTLHTRDNPFRFRGGILRQAAAMGEDGGLVEALGAAYAREGRAGDAASGAAKVREELAIIAHVFEAAEEHLAGIDATVARIERRIANTARYMDRIQNRSEVGLADAMKAVAAAKGDAISVAPALLPRILPLGPVHIPAPRREKPAITRTILSDRAPDPAALLYARAKEEYVRRTRVTPERLSAYLETALAGRPEMRGRDMPIESVDDFVAFQRLREIPSIFNGTLARSYEIELLTERCSNDWITCQDFLIRRRGEASRNAA